MFGLALFDIVVGALLFIALLVGVSFDRHGKDEPKWIILGLGVIGIAIAYWGNWTFAGVWRWLSSGVYLEPLAVYVAIGLLYSIVEFVFALRRAEREYADRWTKNKANMKVDEFVRFYQDQSHLFRLKLEDNKPVPTVDRMELADSIAAWTLLWPPYLFSLVFGDLLLEIWRALADVFAALSTRLVRYTFRNTFK